MVWETGSKSLREIGEPARKTLITSLMPDPVRARIRDILAEAESRIGLGGHRIETAIANLHLPSRCRARVSRCDQDCAARRISTKQSTLWPFKHLDVLDLQQLKVCDCGIGLKEAVNIDAHIRTSARSCDCRAHAADARLDI
mgnify:CR=1 FL=1